LYEYSSRVPWNEPSSSVPAVERPVVKRKFIDSYGNTMSPLLIRIAHLPKDQQITVEDFLANVKGKILDKDGNVVESDVQTIPGNSDRKMAKRAARRSKEAAEALIATAPEAGEEE
jgi:methionyl-tRNA synthetase